MKELLLDMILKKSLTILTLILLLGVLIASLSQFTELVSSLVSGNPVDNAMRALLSVALVTLLYVERPRSLPVRGLMVAIASMTLLYALTRASDMVLGGVDCVLYGLAVTLIMIEAVEASSPVDASFSQSKKYI